MNKKIVIIGIMFLLGVVVLARMFSSEPQEAYPEGTVFPDTGVSTETPRPQVPDSDLVTLAVGAGGELQVRNFLEDEDTYELSDDGIYVIGEKDEKIGDKYKIYYHDFDGSIIISLRSVPLATARKLAEDEIKKTTGLSEGQLCALNLLVNTPGSISQTYSGRNLGLSFCPGSVSLE